MQDNMLFWDLETLPAEGQAAERVAANLKPPANYKSEDAINKWMAENRDKAVRATALDGTYGRIVSIAWARYAEPVQVAYAETAADEPDLLRRFFADGIDEFHHQCHCGHNLTMFDLPFILKRSVINGVNLPSNASLPRQPKQWSDNIWDTMVKFSGTRDRISQDNLAYVLGLPQKEGMTGKDVYDYWLAGRHTEIQEYNKQDVETVRSIYNKFQKVGW